MSQYLLQLNYLVALVYKGRDDFKNALKHFNKIYSVDVSYEGVESQIKKIEDNN